ncbi:hypothetical protein B0H19DRAFT_1015076 [Mycena capillaripes]|nr:hypothetical protein B0H19DRAFT_1015076 [Mycena capillaripes]
MQLGSDVSIANPKDQDPGMVECVQSNECTEAIIQRRLDNPPHTCHSSYDCCNQCDPLLDSGWQLQWIEVSPGVPTVPAATVKTTDTQRDLINNKLVAWRLQHWRSAWRDKWPSYGPKTLIPDSDLVTLAAHTTKIFCIEDMCLHTHIVHWAELSPYLFETLQQICSDLKLIPKKPAPDVPHPDLRQPKRRETTPKEKPEVLQAR